MMPVLSQLRIHDLINYNTKTRPQTASASDLSERGFSKLRGNQRQLCLPTQMMLGLNMETRPDRPKYNDKDNDNDNDKDNDNCKFSLSPILYSPL